MYILSIDPGIVNLGICLIETDNIDLDTVRGNKILYWDSINIISGTSNKTINCNGLLKSGLPCKGIVTKKLLSSYFCNKHGKGEGVLIDTGTRVKFMEFQKICKYLITFFNDLTNLPCFEKIDHILIENQQKSTERIRFVSNVIFTYLCTKYDLSKIQFIHGKYKLLVDYNGPEITCTKKSKYDKNKFYSIKYCEYFIKDSSWKEYLEKYKKKDELADCLCFVIYFIENNYVIFKKKEKIYNKITQKYKKKKK